MTSDDHRFPLFSVRSTLFALTLFTVTLLAFPAFAHPGVGIVMDSRGNVFFTDLRHVWKVTPSGEKRIAVANVHTHELAIDAYDNLYGEHLWYEGEATDKWGHYIWRLGPDGKLARITAPREGFRSGYSFVRDAAGNMYWIERGPGTVLKKRTPNGAISIIPTSADFRDVRWMSATSDGTIYLIDLYDVRKIRPDGSVFTLARNLASRRLTQFHVGDRHLLMGIWTDHGANVYVASYGSREVKKVTPAGRVSILARSPPPWSPTGGLVAPNGDTWLLEYSITNKARARRIRPDGRSRTY